MAVTTIVVVMLPALPGAIEVECSDLVPGVAIITLVSFIVPDQPTISMYLTADDHGSDGCTLELRLPKATQKAWSLILHGRHPSTQSLPWRPHLIKACAQERNQRSAAEASYTRRFFKIPPPSPVSFLANVNPESRTPARVIKAGSKRIRRAWNSRRANEQSANARTPKTPQSRLQAPEHHCPSNSNPFPVIALKVDHRRLPLMLAVVIATVLPAVGSVVVSLIAIVAATRAAGLATVAATGLTIVVSSLGVMRAGLVQGVARAAVTVVADSCREDSQRRVDSRKMTADSRRRSCDSLPVTVMPSRTDFGTTVERVGTIRGEVVEPVMRGALTVDPSSWKGRDEELVDVAGSRSPCCCSCCEDLEHCCLLSHRHMLSTTTENNHSRSSRQYDSCRC
ncbi:hypothetical protein BJ546DRAFT_951491 [Cryomyces antarcticus]